MKCPGCGHRFNEFSGPCWRSVSDEPPVNVEVRVYFAGSRRWGRATWTGEAWRMRDPEDIHFTVTDWYDDCVLPKFNQDKP